MMNINSIKKALSGYDKDKVSIYTDYLSGLAAEKQRTGKPKNPWMQYRSDQDLVGFFEKVITAGSYIDGVNITILSTGISYNYVAYKNKMLSVYPETLIDTALVYKDDTFNFKKQSGKVTYSHEINNPFNQEESNIIGGYCIIKNKRGEFITLLSKDIINKHRKVARTDSIWSGWFHEMCFKTLIKKACKQHFDDIYQDIETMDNTQYNLDLPLGVSIDDKAAVEQIDDIEELKEYWKIHRGRNAGVRKDFNLLISNRKAEIEKANEELIVEADGNTKG